MLAIFEGSLPKTPAYNSFMLPSETVYRIRHATTSVDAAAAFDLEIRRQLGFLSFQYPDKIADGIRMCSSAELWNEVAMRQGATQQNKVAQAKQIKRQLTTIIDRRNKIAHEGDLQPKALPISPWPISQADLTIVTTYVEKLVRSIDECVVAV